MNLAVRAPHRCHSQTPPSRAAPIIVLVLGIMAMLITTAQVQAAPQASVTPKITYFNGVSATIHLKLSEEGKYKVRLKVNWGKKSARVVSFAFRTDGDFQRQCPNSTCAPLVWVFDYNHVQTAQAPEFEFMTAGVTAQITMWKAGGPLAFKRTYTSYWIDQSGIRTFRVKQLTSR
jgi:hypothetical protein